MAKKEIDTSHLNAQQFRELVQVQKDVFYFSTFAYVVHPVRGKTRFLLYPYQKSVLYCFLKHRFNIILKFRQAGITELISLYCLWLTMYHPNKKVNIISLKDSVAKKVLKKIKYMYKNLPEHLKVPIVNGRIGELGTACITGDTMILGTKTDFPIQSIAPSEKGYLDVSGLNIRVLTENGTFERVMKTFNKGKLKTYTIVNDRGLTLRCTPKHKLLTTKGWKTVGEILKNNLTVVFKDTKELVSLAPPKVEKPVTEEIRETNIPGYWVSNLGRVFTMNRVLKQSVHQTETLSYKQIGRVKELLKRDKYLNREIAKRVSGGDKDLLDQKKVSRISRGKNCSDIYISKITKVDTTLETIYDMEVENYHSYITTNGYINHNSMIEFINGSFIESIPTSEEAGRSESLSLLVIDEAAIVRWASTIWAAAAPAISTGGAAILNSCITGNTKIITDKGLIKVKNLCPKTFGAVDLSFVSNLRVLTHKGEWKRIVASVNKGKLETWKIQSEYGTILKCTPNHKLYTLKGWMSVKDIIENDEKVILYKTGLSELIDPPKIMWPEKEEWKSVKGYPNYQVSNRGELKYLRGGKWHNKNLRPNKLGYVRVTLHKNNSSRHFRMADLVISHFTNLKVGKDQVIDHIDCVPYHNWVTNLRVISRKENTKRANLYSYGLKLGTMVGKGFTDLDSIATVLNGTETGELEKLGTLEFIKNNPTIFGSMSIESSRSYIAKVRRGDKGHQVKLSKLKVLRKFKATIYDITVEDHHSYITYNFSKTRKGPQEEYNFINKNTPYGISGFYHSKWVESITDSDSPFHPIRLYWKMHPERDQKWYDTMSKTLGPRRTAQEIDGDFLSSGSTVFDLTDIKAIEDTLSEYPVIETRFNGQLRIMDKPKQGVRYFIGADVATGRSNDYSAFTLGDSNGEEAAVFKGRIPVEKYAKILGNLGKEFNWATIAPETNDIGLAVTTLLQTEGYPQLYYHKKLLKKKGKSRPEVEQYPGWITTSKNRSLIIDGLEEDIRKDNITIKDPFFVQEAYTFIYDSIGRPVAMGKHNRNNQTSDIDMDEETYSDDSIFGKAIYNHVRKNYKPSLIIQPK